MDSTVPADRLKLKTRLEAWRATRRYARQPIPDEFRQAAAEMAGRYSPSLVRSVLKLDPWRLKKPSTKNPTLAHHEPQTDFFSLPPEAALLLPGPSEVNARYQAVENDGKVVQYGGDSYSLSWLPPGRPVIFSVSCEHLSKDRSIYVYFNYEWESGQEYSNNLSPEHRSMYWGYRLREDAK